MPSSLRRDSLPIDMLLSVVSVLVVAQSSSEIPEGLTNNPVYSQNLRGTRDGHVSKPPRIRPAVATMCLCGVVARLQFEHHESYDIRTSFVV